MRLHVADRERGVSWAFDSSSILCYDGVTATPGNWQITMLTSGVTTMPSNLNLAE